MKIKKLKICTLIYILFYLMLCFEGCAGRESISPPATSEEISCFASNNAQFASFGTYGDYIVAAKEYSLGLSNLYLYDASGKCSTLLRFLPEPMAIQIYDGKVFYQSSIFNGIAGHVYEYDLITGQSKKDIDGIVEHYVAADQKIVYTYKGSNADDNCKFAVFDRNSRESSLICKNTARYFTLFGDTAYYYDLASNEIVSYNIQTITELIRYTFATDEMICRMAADANNVYICAGDNRETIYKLDLKSGESEDIASGYYLALWCFGGKLYFYDSPTIYCFDGDDITVIYTTNSPSERIYDILFNGDKFIAEKDGKLISVDLSGNENVILSEF